MLLRLGLSVFDFSNLSWLEGESNLSELDMSDANLRNLSWPEGKSNL